MLRNKPATPLPWSLPTYAPLVNFLAAGDCIPLREAKDAHESETLPLAFIAGFPNALESSERNARYLIHAANAYPRLVEALRDLLEDSDHDCKDAGSQVAARTLLRAIDEI